MRRVITGMTDGELTDTQQRVLDSIEAHGWHSMHIFHPDLEAPNFTYTIGFSQTLNAPEFIVFGLHRDDMHDMLAEVFRQLKAGRKLESEQRWTGLHPDFDCIGRKASHPDLFSKYAALADWFWHLSGQKGHPALMQLVWPGLVDGLYPWEDGCKPHVIAAQTPLWS